MWQSTMRSIRERTRPILVIALLALLLGPAAGALVRPCAMKSFEAGAQAGCQCMAVGSDAGTCWLAASAGGAMHCALQESAEAASSPDGAPGAQPRATCTCGLADSTPPPAALAPDSARSRALIADAVSGAAVLPVVAAVGAPEGASLLPPATGGLPGHQYESRPDAGRAPPAC